PQSGRARSASIAIGRAGVGTCSVGYGPGSTPPRSQSLPCMRSLSGGLMSSLNDLQQPAIAWLADQQRFGQNIFLMIDRLAEPDPLPELFAQDLMQDYVNLYQVCGWEELASIGPWLIRLTDNQTERLTRLLETPQRNWGWLASAPQLSLSELAAHWQDRILSEQNDARALYRFQDNRVIGHH